MIASRKSPSVTTYTVAGKTLAEIWKDIQKKGPVDPNDGKRYAGSCKSTFKVDVSDNDVEYEVKPGSAPVEVTAKLAESKGKVSSTPVITMPKLSSNKALSPDAKEEWERFVGFTRTHEENHADSLYLLVIKIARDIAGMTGTGTDADEKKAKAAARKALYAKIIASYDDAKLKALVNADLDAYDTKTHHGETEGAKLDTSIA